MSNVNPPSGSPAPNTKRAEVIIAIITGMVTIIVALLGFPPFVRLFEKDPTSTPTATPVAPAITPAVPTSTTVVIDLPVITDTLEPTITSTATATETPSLFIGMHVRVYADKTSGKAPLSVKLDARDSFLRAANNQEYVCRNGPCTYTWAVYTGGSKIGTTVTNSTGTFQYKFTKKGYYMVTVVVCRGGGSDDCNGGGVQFEVR